MLVSLVAAPAIAISLLRFFLDQTAFFCAKASSTTTYTTALLLSHRRCATSHHSGKAPLPRFAYHPS
jgi:hypothetical protein